MRSLLPVAVGVLLLLAHLATAQVLPEIPQAPDPLPPPTTPPPTTTTTTTTVATTPTTTTTTTTTTVATTPTTTTTTTTIPSTTTTVATTTATTTTTTTTTTTADVTNTTTAAVPTTTDLPTTTTQPATTAAASATAIATVAASASPLLPDITPSLPAEPSSTQPPPEQVPAPQQPSTTPVSPQPSEQPPTRASSTPAPQVSVTLPSTASPLPDVTETPLPGLSVSPIESKKPSPSLVPLGTFTPRPSLNPLPASVPPGASSPLPQASSPVSTASPIITPASSTQPPPLRPSMESSVQPSMSPHAIPSQALATPQITASPALVTPSFSPAANGTLPAPVVPAEQKACTRDISIPSPYLGTSPLRYTFAVVGSVTCVALASGLYTIASDWEKHHWHVTLRIIAIFVARLLILIAVKTSASLVGTIANSQPDNALEGALDASGAFLTWATAVFTRFYYEAIKMTFVAIGFYSHGAVWDIHLRRYLSPWYKRGTLDKAELEEEALEQETAFERSPEGDPRGSLAHKYLSFGQRFKGGRVDRKLLMLIAFLYMVSEIAILAESLLGLVSYLTAQNRFQFSSFDESGQCGILRADYPLLTGLVATQAVYFLTMQPSLIPLLVFAAMPQPEGRGLGKRIVRHIRRFIAVVLLLWVASLLCLPLFLKQLQPFFIAGDISLFWYIMIAPPAYTSIYYWISTVFTILAAGVGCFVLYGLYQDTRKRKRREEEELSSNFEA